MDLTFLYPVPGCTRSMLALCQRLSNSWSVGVRYIVGVRFITLVQLMLEQRQVIYYFQFNYYQRETYENSYQCWLWKYEINIFGYVGIDQLLR